MAKKDFSDIESPSVGFVNSIQKEMIESIVIDPEFKDLIPPLSNDEFVQLEENILKEGFTSPIIIWQFGGRNILVDGHNRYSIALKNKIQDKLKFVLVSFIDREEVNDWIIKNQLGRRNLNYDQMSYFRGLVYAKSKKSHGGDRKSGGQNDHLEKPKEKTVEKISRQFNVSPKTIQRDEKYVQDVETIAQVMPEIKKEIVSGKSKKTKKEISEMAEEIRTGNNLGLVGKKKDTGTLPKTAIIPKTDSSYWKEFELQDIESYTPESLSLAMKRFIGDIRMDKKDMYGMFKMMVAEFKKKNR